MQDYATCVGLGWQLNAGGNISRVVRGFPDEFPNGYLGTGLTGQKLENYYNGVAGATFPAGVNNGLSVPTNDGEPDIYYVRTPVFSFQFTFDGNGNPVFNNETGVKITSFNFFNSSSYLNSTFIITDPNGNSYAFGTYKEKTTTTLYGTSSTFTTTWYLSSIYTFNSKDYTFFDYTTSPNNDQLVHYFHTRTYYSGCIENSTDTIIPNTIIQPVYLSSISSANGRIDFSYIFDRRDVTTAGRLSSIVLKSSSVLGTTTLKSFGFNYSYFGDPTADPNRLRLKLNSITIAGGTTATSTPVTYRTFTYNTSVNLPNRVSHYFDYWGYYNSFTPLTSPDPMADPTLRVANGLQTQANILTGITELTGASWALTYELNSYYKTSNGTNANVNVGGLRVKTISRTLPAGDNVVMTYQYNDNTGKSTGQVLTESYNNLVLIYNLTQRVFSETPSNIYDINGSFIGYSSVKTVHQNGGYSITNFYNFSDFPDISSYVPGVNPSVAPNITSSISWAHKRGLMTSQVTYNSSNNKITEDVNTFSALNSPVIKKAWAFHWYVASVMACGNGGAATFNSNYYRNVENYRLSSTTHKDYDQITHASFVQITTNFTYCSNKRTIQTVGTTDSKGNTVSKTVYHVHDTGIPMVNSPEQSAISSMQSLNNLDAPVHEINNKNGAITQAHNMYSITVGSSVKPYLVGTAAYKGSTLLSTQNFVYETDYSNMVSTNTTGGKSNAVIFGYNNSYPIATISNAGSFYTTQQGTGSISNNFTSGYATSFTSDYAGTIGWSVYGMGITGSVSVSYNLTGPSPKSGSGCIGTGTGCSSYTSVSFPNMPAGSYSLYISVTGNTAGASFYLTGAYPKNVPVFNTEYFFEGFEENSGAISGNAHTGNKYRDASSSSYSVYFTAPNARNYLIQWWSWVNGKWILNETAYTGPRTLNGIIDDVRIFPVDAKMTTFSYDPLTGKTGETDPSGRSGTYEYDGLGRLNIVRDNDKNIISKNCYNYAGQIGNCPAATVYSNIAKSGIFTRNNCSAGYIGSSVTYNVAAGTYTSSIGQADADQQAVNDVNTNGQNYANLNGSCYQIWYNVVKSGNFTRNNCGSGSTGSTVTYTVAAGTYSSIISQADADQTAQNNVNTNGQAFANANGTCTPLSCSFSMASGFSSPTNSISAYNGTVSFYLVFYSTSTSMIVGSSYFVATVTGGCPPSATRIINLSSGGRNWEMTIYTNGQMALKITSGTNLPQGSTVSFSSGSYPL